MGQLTRLEYEHELLRMSASFSEKAAVTQSDFPPEARGVTVFEKITIQSSAVADRYEIETCAIYATALPGGSA